MRRSGMERKLERAPATVPVSRMAIARPTDRYPDPSWSGWGDPTQTPVLGEGMRALLAQGLGVREPKAAAVALSEVRLPGSRLGPSAAAELAEVVGHDHALSDDETRVRHTRGKSLADLLRLRAGEAADAPDLVLGPGSQDELLACLRVCSERRIAVVPFGGGTSVVGGVGAPGRGLGRGRGVAPRRVDR